MSTTRAASRPRRFMFTGFTFTVPTVTNGHVYVGIDGALVGYGLLPQT